MEVRSNPRKERIEKWIELGMTQRVEQIRETADMLTAYMEDMIDHLIEIEYSLEGLNEMNEDIARELEDMTILIENQIIPDGGEESKEQKEDDEDMLH